MKKSLGIVAGIFTLVLLIAIIINQPRSIAHATAPASTFSGSTTVDVSNIQPKGIVSYTVTFINKTSVPQTNIRIADLRPSGMIFVSTGSTVGCALVGSYVTCPTQTVASGSQISATINMQLFAGSACGGTNQIDNIAYVQQAGVNITPTNHAVTPIVCPTPTFAGTTTADVQSLMAKDYITYIITFTNNSAVTQNNVRIVDVRPSGMMVMSTGSSLGCTGDTIVCPSQNIAPGGQITAVLRMQLFAGAACGGTNQIDNSAYVQQNGVNVIQTNHVLTPVVCPVLVPVPLTVTGSTDSCMLSLTPDLYAVTGRELNMYFDDVTRCTKPMNQYAPDIVFGSTTEHDVQMERFWRYTPASGAARDIPLVYTVYDYLWNALASTISTVHVTPANSGTGVVRKVLILGDSATSPGIYPDEVARLFSTDPMQVSLIGTQGTGLSRYEGYGGKTYNWFHTDPASPLVSSGSFSMSHYLSAHNFTMNTQDWVIFNLGGNDIGGSMSDADMVTKERGIQTDLDAMITSIKTAIPGVRIAIVSYMAPSASQDAFGNNYGSGLNSYRFHRNRDLFNLFIAKTYGQRTSENLYILPLNSALDPIYGMQHATGAVNARNQTLIDMMSNGVHPAVSGYLQIADAVYAFLKYWK